MKPKTIFWCALSGTIIFSAWWWHTRSGSKHPDEQTAAARQTNAPQQAQGGATAKSSQAVNILSHPTQIPDQATIAKLTSADEAVLLSEYLRKTNMVERISLIWSLAYIGGDASLAAFKHTLTDEFAGRQLSSVHDMETSNESNLMHSLVWAIGVIAQKNDKALDLLKQGTDSWFWQKSVKWNSGYREDNYGILAGRAMQAIGISGRIEVPEIFESLSKQPLINEPDPAPLKRTMSGEVVDGAFYYAIVKNEGRDAFLNWFLTPKGDVFDADGKFAKWSATADGRKWHQWSDEFEKASLIKQEERLKQAQQK